MLIHSLQHYKLQYIIDDECPMYGTDSDGTRYVHFQLSECGHIATMVLANPLVDIALPIEQLIIDSLAGPWGNLVFSRFAADHPRPGSGPALTTEKEHSSCNVRRAAVIERLRRRCERLRGLPSLPEQLAVVIDHERLKGMLLMQSLGTLRTGLGMTDQDWDAFLAPF